MLRKSCELGPIPGNCSTNPGNACTAHLGCVLLLRIPGMHTHSWELISQSWEFKRLRCTLLALIPRKERQIPGNFFQIPGICVSHLACWYPSFPGLLHNPGNTCTTRRVRLYSGMNHSQELDTIPGNSYQILGNACITLHIALCLVPGIAFLVVTFPGMTVTMLGIRSQELVKMCRFPGNACKTRPIQQFGF